jgi:hypothetical protein
LPLFMQFPLDESSPLLVRCKVSDTISSPMTRCKIAFHHMKQIQVTGSWHVDALPCQLLQHLISGFHILYTADSSLIPPWLVTSLTYCLWFVSHKIGETAGLMEHWCFMKLLSA